jgi:hypothetical protein
MIVYLFCFIIVCIIPEIYCLRYNNIKKFISSTILVSGLSGLSLNPVIAATIPTNTYINERYHTSFDYPKNWIKSEGQLSGGRPIEVFVDPTDDATSVSVVITAIPADFTKLGSFGGGKETIRF